MRLIVLTGFICLICAGCAQRSGPGFGDASDDGIFPGSSRTQEAPWKEQVAWTDAEPVRGPAPAASAARQKPGLAETVDELFEIGKARATEGEARASHARATELVQQTRDLVGPWTGADASLARAGSLLNQNDWGSALSESEEAIARAEQAISSHYAKIADLELQKTYNFTGLEKEQIGQIQAAEEIMITGNSRLAYGRLRTLNGELESRYDVYTVASGDSLWQIARRPEVYDNAWLWPLIWRSNLPELPNPDRLRQGQILQLKPHPTVDEVASALQESRQRAGLPSGSSSSGGAASKAKTVTPDIGVIREARDDEFYETEAETN